MSLLLLFGGGGGGGGGPAVEAGLARVRDKLRLQLVRRLGDAGGPRADDVDAELDSLIAWAKDAPRCIHRDTDEVGNITTGVDDLQVFTLPAGTLATDGDYLTVDYGGSFAANNNDKRALALFDGQAYEDGLAAPVDLDGGANNGWRFLNRIVRVDSTHVRIHSLFATQFIFMDSTGAVAAPGNAGFLHLNRSVLLTVSDLDSNDIDMGCQGEGTSTDDVVQDMSIIELCQQ